MLRQAIVLAAGKGTRLRPLTDRRPKCMLPVGNKPLLQHWWEKLSALGLEVVVVRSKEDWQSRELLKDKVKWCVQREQLGTGHALHQAKSFVEDEYFLCVYADIFTDFDLYPLLNTCEALLCGVEVRDTQRYGRVEIEGSKLIGIVEKSLGGPGVANAGIYVLPSTILDVELQLSPRNEYELTDAINKLNQSVRFKVHLIKDYWSDVGYPWDLLDANLYYLDRLGKVIVADSAEVSPSAVLKPPVLIGENSKIKNCVIERSAIGNGCLIGEFCVVKRSVVMECTKIPHLNYVADSLIGARCNLGAGTVVANLRFDEASVRCKIKGQSVSTGKRKFGVVMGDECKTGINVSLMPGIKLGPRSIVGPGTVVKHDVEANQKVFAEQNLRVKPLT